MTDFEAEAKAICQKLGDVGEVGWGCATVQRYDSVIVLQFCG